MSCNSEGETNIHPAAVALNWSIEEFIDFGEGDNFIELPADLCARHSQNCAVQKDVFAAGKFRMKTCSDFQQTRYPATNANATLSWLGNPAENFQQSRFPRAVTADDAHDFALPDFNIDIANGPELFDT